MVTLTQDFFIFEPNLDDPFVTKNGVLKAQLFLSLSDIFDCQIVKENERFFYENTLEISHLEQSSMTINVFDFSLDASQLRIVYKKFAAWLSVVQQENLKNIMAHNSNLSVNLNNSGGSNNNANHSSTLVHTNFLMKNLDEDEEGTESPKTGKQEEKEEKNMNNKKQTEKMKVSAESFEDGLLFSDGSTGLADPSKLLDRDSFEDVNKHTKKKMIHFFPLDCELAS
jgi:hypothetical protein